MFLIILTSPRLFLTKGKNLAELSPELFAKVCNLFLFFDLSSPKAFAFLYNCSCMTVYVARELRASKTSRKEF
jgi:hypothetical protein